ncbi:MerR family transcriptional regulator [uncultured Alistipes sp.]|uniref:MerR family transcriptional regulator n=1 Tax=uncultured Alistipes sp. TaxID=538949 RepID=UPI0026125997|nr:MerR family transcriptional regulator [uncultured Alistipes sp.]
MAEKLFYSMGEVAEMFDVAPSLLRHWEAQFDVLRPKRNKKGNRLFSPRDVETLKRIYHLVKERGMTLDGARRALGRTPAAAAAVDRDTELMERLQRIRALLVEVREELKEEPAAVPARGAGRGAGRGNADAADAADAAGEALAGAQVAADAAGEALAAGTSAGALAETAAAGVDASDDASVSADAPAPKRRGRKAVVRIAEEGAEGAAGVEGAETQRAAKPASRRGRRRKDDGGDKELFAFYEQSLF